MQNKIKPVGSFDNSQIQKINKNYQQKIDAEEIKLQKTNKDLTQLVDNLSSSTKSKINQINAEIKILEDNIIDLTNKADKEIDQIKQDYNPRIKSLNENEEKMILTNSNKRNKEIPKIEKETDKINSEITKAKDEKELKHKEVQFTDLLLGTIQYQIS